MKNPLRKISPGLFGITLICFFLPFITVSCQRQEIISLTGVQLATGTNIQPPSFPGIDAKPQKIPAEPLVGLAIFSSLLGLGTSFMKAKKSAIAPAGFGTTSLILLLMLKSKIDDEIIKQGQGLILVSYGLGFWLAFFILVLTTVLNVYNLLDEKDTQE